MIETYQRKKETKKREKEKRGLFTKFLSCLFLFLFAFKSKLKEKKKRRTKKKQKKT